MMQHHRAWVMLGLGVAAGVSTLLGGLRPLTAAGAGAALAPPGVAWGYAWWHRATNAQRDIAVEAAELGIVQGWTFASADTQGRITALLAQSSRAGRLPPEAVGIVANMIPQPSPSFSRPRSWYRVQIDRFYETGREAKTRDVSSILLCLVDKPFVPCPRTPTP